MGKGQGDGSAIPNYMLDPNAVLRDENIAWRFGKVPDYSAANDNYQKGDFVCYCSDLHKPRVFAACLPPTTCYSAHSLHTVVICLLRRRSCMPAHPTTVAESVTRSRLLHAKATSSYIYAFVCHVFTTAAPQHVHALTNVSTHLRASILCVHIC